MGSTPWRGANLAKTDGVDKFRNDAGGRRRNFMCRIVCNTTPSANRWQGGWPWQGSQRRHTGEDALSCFDTSGLREQVLQSASSSHSTPCERESARWCAAIIEGVLLLGHARRRIALELFECAQQCFG